jgi:hypothetical protein
MTTDQDVLKAREMDRPPHMIALVDMVETVTIESLMQEPGEPIWRIEIGGYCADFEHSEAANNFANAINAACEAAIRQTREECATCICGGE